MLHVQEVAGWQTEEYAAFKICAMNSIFNTDNLLGTLLVD